MDKARRGARGRCSGAEVFRALKRARGDVWWAAEADEEGRPPSWQAELPRVAVDSGGRLRGLGGFRRAMQRLCDPSKLPGGGRRGVRRRTAINGQPGYCRWQGALGGPRWQHRG